MNLLLLSHPPRVSFTLLLCVGLALLGVQLSRQQSFDVQTESASGLAQANLFRLTTQLATHQQQTLAETNQRLRALGGLSLVTVFDSSVCNRLLGRQLDTIPGVDNLIVVDSQGRMRCSATPLTELFPPDFFSTSNLRSADHFLLLRAYADKITLAAPLLTPAGKEDGFVIAIASSAAWLRTSPIEIPADISLTLLQPDGQVLITEEPNVSRLNKLPAPLKSGVTAGLEDGGKQYWQAAARMNGPHGLTLLARQHAAHTGWETSSALFVLAGFSLFILATIAALHLARTWRNPAWRRLQHKCSRISARFFEWLRNSIALLNGLKTVALLRRTNADLKRALVCQETRAYQLQRLDQLNQILLSSSSLREAANAISHCAQALLPNCGGALLLRSRPWPRVQK